MRLSVLLLILLLISCTDHKEKSTIQSKDQQKKIVKKKLSKAQVNPKKIEIEEEIESKEQEQKNSLDSIKMAVNKWNDVINTGDFVQLSALYTDQVQFYLKSWPKSEVIKSKREFYKRNPYYAQSIKIRQVQYPTENEDIIRCKIDKTFKIKDKEETVQAILEFNLINNEYLISKESDMPSEINLVKMQSPIEHQNKSMAYANDYWLDTRGKDSGLGHSFVPYYTVVDVNNEDSLYVTFYHYSGSLREMRNFDVKDEKIENGYLTFRAAPIYEEERPLKEEDYQLFKFKLFVDNIALVDTDDWFMEDVGIRFWKLK